MKCINCGEKVIFDAPVPEAKAAGYHGAWMCGCRTVRNQMTYMFPECWVEE